MNSMPAGIVDYSEEVIQFACGGENLFGIVSRPAVPLPSMADCGVLILVGGPQYRVGSHRQFVLLARRLAAAGIAAMRFDYRGMGDSSGAVRDFEQVDEDIDAAIDAMQAALPGLQRIVLWGLCDAASAALLYCYERKDSRIAGMCLLNPWVRSEATLARAHVKHYYGQRLLQRDFWLKLLRGKMNLHGAFGGLLNSLRLWLGHRETPVERPPFQARMAQAMKAFSGPILLVLSGDDYTAKEFIECAGNDALWDGALQAGNVVRFDIAEADHTFSSTRLRSLAEQTTLDWLHASLGLTASAETR